MSVDDPLGGGGADIYHVSHPPPPPTEMSSLGTKSGEEALTAKLAAFTIFYFLCGFAVLRMRLWDPLDWPLFMKRAVAGSTDYETWPPGSLPATTTTIWPGRRKRRPWPWWGEKKRKNTTNSRGQGDEDGSSGGTGTWLEMVDRTASGVNTLPEANGGQGSSSKAPGVISDVSEPSVPKKAHHSTTTTTAEGFHAVEEDEERNINELGRQIPIESTTCISPPPIKKMRKTGLLLVSLTGFLLMLLWPIFLVWTIIWWIIYSIWAVDYIYFSTRRARAIAKSHSDVTVSHIPPPPPPNNAICVTTERTVIIGDSKAANKGRSESQQHSSGSGSSPAAAVFDDDENARGYSVTIATGTRAVGRTTSSTRAIATVPQFKSFYSPAKPSSRKIKTLLEYDSTMPTPRWSRAALLFAERKRRDVLDLAAAALPPRPVAHPTAADFHASSSNIDGRDTTPSLPSESSSSQQAQTAGSCSYDSTSETNRGIVHDTILQSSRIPIRRSSFFQRQYLFSIQESERGQRGSKNKSTQTKRQSGMMMMTNSRQRQSGHDDDDDDDDEDEGAEEGIEMRCLTPSTLARLPPSRGAITSSTVKETKRSHSTGEQSYSNETTTPTQLPFRHSHWQSVLVTQGDGYGDGAGNGIGTTGSPQGRSETAAQAVQVVIPRLRRAGDTIIVLNTSTTATSHMTKTASPRRTQQHQHQSYRPPGGGDPNTVKGLVEGRLEQQQQQQQQHERNSISILPSQGGQLQLHNSSVQCSPVIRRPPTPDRRSSIRNVRGLFTIQEQLEGDGQPRAP